MDWKLILIQTVSASIGPLSIVYILAAQGLNIHYGYTGLFNFGQAGFMAVGAYSLSVTSTTVSKGGYGHSLWIGLAVGLAASVLLALVMGLPTLRLRGDYLAIVTIAASEIIRLVLRSERFDDHTGGNSGINGVAQGFYEANPFVNGRRYEWGPFSFSGKNLWLMIIGWGAVAFFALLTWMLMRSPWGRVLRSIRENEDAVRSLGKNVQAYKMQSLILGGVMGSAGGMVLALFRNLAIPDDYVTRTTFIAYAALILGGAATTWGPVIGGVIWYSMFTFMTNLVSELVNVGAFPSGLETEAKVLPFIFLGVVLMALVVFRPQGIFGNRREVELDAH